MRVVIVGGGYAGLACALDLRQLAPRAELCLVDPGAAHVKQTRLQEALGRPLAEISVPFAALAGQHRLEHRRTALGARGRFTPQNLRTWQKRHALRLDGELVGFDYLVIATGARPRLAAAGTDGERRVYDQLDLRAREGAELVEELLRLPAAGATIASIVGGGASGVQYAFELAELLRRRGSRARVRLIDSGAQPLAGLARPARDYVCERMRAAGIEHLPRTFFLGQSGARLRVRGVDGGAAQTLDSSLTLLFGGVAAHPCPFEANRYGQLLLDGAPLPAVFGAGDCVRYAGRGLNAATAQAAVRKGKLVAANILRLHRGRSPIAYGHQELGYVVSLGSDDAVGWLLARDNVVRGLAATACRKIVEAQYDLFIDGLDTYLL